MNSNDLDRRRRDLEELLARERNERRAALADAHAKATILGVLGRELRAPINAALSWSQFVRRELLSQSGREHALGISERHLHNLVALVDDLLDIGDVAREAVAPRIERISLAEVFARLAREGVHVSVEPGLALRGDTLRVARLLDRFLTSAVGSATGPVAVTTRLDGDLIQIEATFAPSDTCPKALAETWDAVVNSADTGPIGAIGTGLFVAQKLSESLGGTLCFRVEGRASLMLSLPSAPIPLISDDLTERERLGHDLRTSLQVLTLGLDHVQARVRDADVPREWLAERLEQLRAAVDRLNDIARRVSAGERPLPSPPPREGL